MDSWNRFLELRENLSRIGANLKQRFVESVKETWATINDFARAHTGAQAADEPDSPGGRNDASDTESQSKLKVILSFPFFVFIAEKFHSRFLWL